MVLAMQGRWRAFEVYHKKEKANPLFEQCSIPLKRLLRDMLRFDADERVTLEGVLRHEWMVADPPPLSPSVR